MSSFVVLLDACVIFPISLRDILLRATDAGLYRLVLTEDILEEVRRNLISERRLTEDKAQSLIETIKRYFHDAFITHHTLLIASMPINEKDRHILAAAVASNAQVIVTQNLKDFPSELISPFGIEAQSPDEFLVHLFYLAPQAVVKLIRDQASDLQNPRMSPLGLLTILKLHAPTFVALVLSIMGKDTWQPIHFYLQKPALR